MYVCVLCILVCVCIGVIHRESEDTVLMILKEIYSLMGVTAQKSGTDVAPVHQQLMWCPYLPNVAAGFPPPGPSDSQPLLPFRPAALEPQFAGGSPGVANVPMFAPAPQLSGSAAISSPSQPTAPGTAAMHLDSSVNPAAGQPPAVGPPPLSGFVRK